MDTLVNIKNTVCTCTLTCMYVCMYVNANWASWLLGERCQVFFLLYTSKQKQKNEEL